MNQTCRQCAKTFEVTEDNLKSIDKVSPVIDGKKYPIPSPEKCPACRQQQRLAFRNERKLYKRKCDLCSADIIAMYSPDKPFKVYCPDCWWGDKWSPLDYGRDFDYSRPFFEQFEELVLDVPHLSLTSDKFAVENNCSYINFAGNSKNCYMIFDSDYDEDSYYSNVLKHSKSCMDCSYTQKSELCYECIDCSNCYNLKYSQDCTTCSDSYFLKNCKGCSDCVLCANLQGKKYHILNQPHTKEEYNEAIKEFNFGSHTSIKELNEKLQKHILKYPQKFRHSLNTINSTGDYIFNTKNCKECYNVAEAEDCSYCDSLYRAKDCYDVSSFGEGIEKIYDSGTVGINVYEVLFSQIVVPNSNSLIYCNSVRIASNCFGSSCLKSNKFVILNKQYSKEDYYKEVEKIIKHMQSTNEWGNHFPYELAMFGYNETVAQEYFPLTKELAHELGTGWKDEDATNIKSDQSVQIEDSIRNVSSEITNQVLSCEKCSKKYKIIGQELQYYQTNNIPVPRNCPDCRHQARISKRTPRKLYSRTCNNCSTSIQTTYNPDRPETVYCEKCYLEALY